MNVALTAWENRISPVFDSARSLMIATIENGEIVSRRYETINPDCISHLADRLCSLKVDVLICGAISQGPSDVIEANGIRLISFIGGDIDTVLGSYARNERLAPCFFLPGCGRRERRRNRTGKTRPGRQPGGLKSQ